MLIDVRNLSFTYSGAATKALDTINLKVNKGEFVGIIGVNNSGKSSLCHALAGVIPHLYHGDMQGLVRVAGKDTNNESVATMATHVALVMQKPEQQLSGVRFTVREEIAFSLENQGTPVTEMQQRVDQAMHKAGLSGFADSSPHRLSGGQLQRLVLAAALVTAAPVLVLDEPTTFLDPQGAHKTFDVLKQLSREGMTVILAEQRLESIALHADRVVALHNGAVVLDSPPEVVLVSPLLREIGLGWTRYTRAAHLARQHGLWPEDKALPATLDATCAGLRHA